MEEFVDTWSAQDAVEKILISLYTPQTGEVSDERLTAEDRSRVVADLLSIRTRFPKLAMPKAMVEAYAAPPASPAECVFAKTTACVSADLDTRIGPCQFGGAPVCEECGCAVSAGLAAVGRHQLLGGLRVDTLLHASLRVGKVVNRAGSILPSARVPAETATS